MTARRQAHAPVTLLGRTLPAALIGGVHVLAADTALECDARWRDVFAVVEHGSVEVRGASGARLTLPEGASLCFTLTGPVVLRAVDSPRAVLSTVRRTARPEDVR